MTTETASVRPMLKDALTAKKRDTFSWTPDGADRLLNDYEAEVRKEVTAKVLAVHPTVKVYRECEHDVHTEGDLNAGTAVYVYELGIVCTDGFMYEVCGSCCWVEDYGQTEDCVTDHEDKHRKGWLCATHDALKGGERGE